jgi:hypothetical protein
MNLHISKQMMDRLLFEDHGERALKLSIYVTIQMLRLCACSLLGLSPMKELEYSIL